LCAYNNSRSILLRYGVLVHEEEKGAPHAENGFFILSVFCGRACSKTLDQGCLFGKNHNGSTKYHTLFINLKSLEKKSINLSRKKLKISNFSSIFFFL
jgi:hypothetical protein